jgi:hypothetical protein
MRYNPPPNWPPQPDGWTPPPGWEPDPTWGDPPHGWPLWVEDRPVVLVKPGPAWWKGLIAVAAIFAVLVAISHALENFNVVG